MKTSGVIWHLPQMRSLLFIYRYSLAGILFFSPVVFKTSLYAWSLQCYHPASTCALISIFFHCSSCSLKHEDLLISLTLKCLPSLWVICHHPVFLLNFLLDVCWSLSICVFKSLFPPFPHFFNLTVFVLHSCGISNITIRSTITSFNRYQSRIHCMPYSTAFICHGQDL